VPNRQTSSVQDKSAEREASLAKLAAEGPEFRTSGWDSAKFGRALTLLDGDVGDSIAGPVLDLGCGSMGLSNELGKRGLKPVGADLVYEILRDVAATRAPGVPTVACDAELLPFRNESLALVAHNQTLHHFPDPRPVLRDIRRVLKPGGLLLSIETNGWNPYVYYSHTTPAKKKSRFISENQKVFGVIKFQKMLVNEGFRIRGRRLINFDFARFLSPFDSILGKIPLVNLIFSGSMVILSEKARQR